MAEDRAAALRAVRALQRGGILPAERDRIFASSMAAQNTKGDG